MFGGGLKIFKCPFISMQVHNYREILQNTHKNWRKFDVVFYLYTLKRNITAFDLN